MDPKDCKHQRLSMDRCADCGIQVFHLPQFPGEAPDEGFVLNMNEAIDASKDLASALSETISVMSKRRGGRMPMSLVFTAIRLVRLYAMRRSGIREDQVALIERGVDHLMAPPAPPARGEGH